jgi:phage terminase large subunit-like protein
MSQSNISKQHMSTDEINEKLDGYQQVKNISEVPLNVRLRYFTINPDGTKVSRAGGFLKNKTNADVYVILNNGRNDWSVSTKNTIFYQKISSDAYERTNVFWQE